jgi:hypothetical protein
MSMRRAASWSQPLQEICVPLGARTSVTPIASAITPSDRMLWAKFPKAKGNRPFGELLRRPVQWPSFSSGNGGDMRKTLLGLVALAVLGFGGLAQTRLGVGGSFALGSPVLDVFLESACAQYCHALHIGHLGGGSRREHGLLRGRKLPSYS